MIGWKQSHPFSITADTDILEEWRHWIGIWYDKSMATCKTVVSVLLTQCCQHSLALSHKDYFWYYHYKYIRFTDTSTVEVCIKFILQWLGMSRCVNTIHKYTQYFQLQLYPFLENSRSVKYLARPCWWLFCTTLTEIWMNGIHINIQLSHIGHFSMDVPAMQTETIWLRSL